MRESAFGSERNIPEAVTVSCDRAYGMPSRAQDVTGSRNRCMDVAFEAVGIPLATELETVTAAGHAAQVQITLPTP